MKANASAADSETCSDAPSASAMATVVAAIAMTLRESWHKERMTAMEKGLPLPDVPAQLFSDADTSGARLLRSGISPILIGIVVYVATARATDEDLALFGLIPCAVGVANLIYAALLSRRKQAGSL